MTNLSAFTCKRNDRFSDVQRYSNIMSYFFDILHDVLDQWFLNCNSRPPNGLIFSVVNKLII